MTKTQTPTNGPVTLGNERVDLTVPIPPDPAPAPAPLSARALLDRALDKAEKESKDGLFTIEVEDWGGATVTLRRLSYEQITQAQQAGAGDARATMRLLLLASIVDPPFTKGEVDEILTDPAQSGPAKLLDLALVTLNKLGPEEVAKARAAFRRPSE